MRSVIIALVNVAAILGGLVGAAHESDRAFGHGNPAPFALLALVGAINIVLSHASDSARGWLVLFMRRKQAEERLRLRDVERKIDGDTDIDLPTIRRD